MSLINKNNKYFFESKDVKVFPCAYRGYKDTENNNRVVGFDIEAQMTSEYTLTNLYGKLSENKQSYIISYGSNVLECVIGGYYFKIDIDSIDENTLKQNKYLGIKLKTIDIEDQQQHGDSNRTSKILESFIADTDYYLDPQITVASGEKNIFAGLCAVDGSTTSILTVGFTHYIKVFDDNNNINWDEKTILNSIDTGSGKYSIRMMNENLSDSSSANGDYAVAFGTKNTAGGSNSVVFGNHNNATIANQVVLGQYNADSDDAYLVIGGGTEEDQKNIFEVKTNGAIISSGDATFAGGKVSIGEGNNAFEIENKLDENNLDRITEITGSTKFKNDVIITSSDAKIGFEAETGDISTNGTIHAVGNIITDGAIEANTIITANDVINANKGINVKGASLIVKDSINNDKITLDTNGNISATGTLVVGGKLTANDSVEVKKDLKIIGNLNLSSNTKKLSSAGLIEANKGINVKGASLLVKDGDNNKITLDTNGNIYVDGVIDAKGTISTTENITASHISTDWLKEDTTYDKIILKKAVEIENASLNVTEKITCAETTNSDANNSVVTKGYLDDNFATNEKVFNSINNVFLQDSNDRSEDKDSSIMNSGDKSTETIISNLKKFMLDATYPVGSIYTMYVSSDPNDTKNIKECPTNCPIADTLGGTWERIDGGRFLVAVSDTDSKYSHGTAGGQENTELVKHSHEFNVTGLNITHKINSKLDTHKNGKHQHSIKITSKSTGSGDATGFDDNHGNKDTATFTYFTEKDGEHNHSISTSALANALQIVKIGENSLVVEAGKEEISNTSNLPPYLAVYMWKRVKEKPTTPTSDQVDDTPTE